MLRYGLTQGRSEGLVHFVIGQTLRLAGIFALLYRDGESCQALCGLPGMQIHGSVLALSETAGFWLPFAGRKMGHGVPGVPVGGHGDAQQREQAEYRCKPHPAEEDAVETHAARWFLDAPVIRREAL